jgi:hypothetical protein
MSDVPNDNMPLRRLRFSDQDRRRSSNLRAGSNSLAYA